MLVHIQCGCTLSLSAQGKGKCPGCGKKVKVHISNK